VNGEGGPTDHRGVSTAREGERVRRRLRFELRVRFKLEVEAEGRVGETEVECSRDAMRRLLDWICELDGLRAMVVVVGIEVVRACIGRKGFLSFSGENDGFVGGAMDVGVVDARGEIGADEKWSDGDAGSNSSASCGGERMPREEKEEWMLSWGGSRRSSYSQQGSWASASGVWEKEGRSG